MTTRTPRPGLAKVRTPPILRYRAVRLMAALDGRVRDLIDGADVMSEGATRTEGGASIYYGSTSLLFEADSGELRDDVLGHLAEIFCQDPHARLRAVRIAYREALSRARAPLGPVKAELTVDRNARGLTLCVDVVAPLVASPKRRRGP